MQVQGLEVKKTLNSLLPFHPLTNIEISEYYKNEPRFNGVYSRNNLPNKIKKGAYVINLDEYENTGTHWASLFVKPKYTVYFDSFGIEHIPEEINKFIGNKKIKASIFRIQAYDSIMCGYLWIYKFFDSKVALPDKKSTARTGSGFKKPSSSILADELHKPIIRKFNKRKVYSQFKDNIWGVDLADMQSLSRKNKGMKYLLCVIDLFSKYAIVIPLKDKKGISIVNAFNKVIN